MKTEAFNKLSEFEKLHGTENFKTHDLAHQYASLKMDWWGSNLVFLGIQQTPDGFSPMFNVWD